MCRYFFLVAICYMCVYSLRRKKGKSCNIFRQHFFLLRLVSKIPRLPLHLPFFPFNSFHTISCSIHMYFDNSLHLTGYKRSKLKSFVVKSEKIVELYEETFSTFSFMVVEYNSRSGFHYSLTFASCPSRHNNLEKKPCRFFTRSLLRLQHLGHVNVCMSFCLHLNASCVATWYMRK